MASQENAAGHVQSLSTRRALAVLALCFNLACTRNPVEDAGRIVGTWYWEQRVDPTVKQHEITFGPDATFEWTMETRTTGYKTRISNAGSYEFRAGNLKLKNYTRRTRVFRDGSLTRDKTSANLNETMTVKLRGKELTMTSGNYSVTYVRGD